MQEYRTLLSGLQSSTKENTREQYSLENEIRSLVMNG